MKLTIKQSSIAMAICTSLYAVLLVALQIPAIQLFMNQTTYLPYLPHVAILAGMIILGYGLYTNHQLLPKLSKSLQWQAIGLVVITLCMALYNSFGGIKICGLYYFYWQSTWLHAAITAWVSAWLWQYSYSKTEDSTRNKAIGVIGLLMTFVAALLLVFMLVSFVRVLTVGQVAGFHITSWLSWLRPAVLVALSFAFILGRKGTTDLPQQQTKQVLSYSKANRVIAWISVGMVVVFGLIAIIGLGFDRFADYHFNDKYFVSLCSSVHILWISSVIAMLLEPGIKKWQRVLNVISPLLINGVIVLCLCLGTLIPGGPFRNLSPTLTEDILTIGLIGSMVFPIVVWIINTFTIFYAQHRLKLQNKE